MTRKFLCGSVDWMVTAIGILVSISHAELPLKVRADQALSQLEANIKANNFAGALPWLEKAVALESEGYKLPSGMGFFAGQVYAKNGENAKAVPYLEAYVNQPVPGKNFWEAVRLLCQASSSRGKAYLETYLAQENPPYYHQALALYTQIEPLANAEEELVRSEKQRLLRSEKKKQDSITAMEAQRAALRGVLKDSRDGKTYQTIQIGNQIWMAQNLNYETEKSICYDNNPSNCEKWGRLYAWQAARSACPNGWHLPSDDEWRSLDHLSAKDLRAVDWFGTNESGFNALPSGVCEYVTAEDVIFTLNNAAEFWSSSREPKNASWALTRRIDTDTTYDKLGHSTASIEYDRLSIRCLKD